MAVVQCKQCSTEVPRRTNVCPNCGAVLRETLPPQTTGGSDVFAMLIGLVVGLFQALTSIQEMTLTFVPKLAAIVAVFWLTMGFMTETLVSFFKGTLIPTIVNI